MPQPPRIRKPFHHQHRPALGEAGAVGGARVRLAAAVGRQAPVPAELHEDRRGGVHRRAAGQRQIALARSQRLHRHVQRHQRRRAGGVHRHRRALQPQHIRHPTRRHAGRLAGQPEALRDGCGAHAVALRVHPGEHAGGAAAQLDGVNSGPLQCFPGQLEEHALLGIHGQGFAGGDAEERRVEVGDVVDETAGAGVAGAGDVRVGVVHAGQVPAAIGGKLREHVAALGHHLPQRLGAVHSAREAARHPDDRDRIVVGGADDGRVRDLLRGAGKLGADVAGQGVGCGVVEDQGRRKRQSGRGFEPVAHFDRGQRVEAQFLERLVRVDRLGGRAAQHGGDVGAHQLQQHGVLLGFGQPVEAMRQRGFRFRGGQRVVDPAPGRRVDQLGEHRGHRDRVCAQRAQIDTGRRQEWLVDDQRRVEQFHGLVRGQRQDAVAAQPGQVGGVQAPGHGAGLVPQAPRQRDRRKPVRPPMRRQRIQEGVRRGVVALSGGADQPRHRGKHHERRQIHVAGQLVQVPGRVHLGPQHRVDPLRCQRGDHRVVEHAGGVDHAGQRPLRGNPGDDAGQRGPVGRVAGDHLHPGPGRFQFGDELGRAGRVRAGAAQQRQVANAVAGHQVARQCRARHAGATGDQHGAGGERPGHRHDDLADVAGLAQVAQRGAATPDVKCGDRQRVQHAGVEQPGEFHHPLVHPGTARLEQVEGAVAHAGVFPDHHTRVADVGLAHLQEHAAGRDQP
ncbi:hypothetical protein PICSAR75_04504 [Mycobacterium avium subsp. paratuberculosis]|nr:hypothetical protein PICSAR26_04441 [Mycobacterium avium subsp. paratuberculosis]CAG7406573.1 hypothetical protein PICSAR75_04504 [Mycobacterium avium subsp. paratuberculosis]CAG7422295.1 hypothetical protein PICSAR42_04450 [Mycobacterium avium subsp. paratuberculosis]